MFVVPVVVFFNPLALQLNRLSTAMIDIDFFFFQFSAIPLRNKYFFPERGFFNNCVIEASIDVCIEFAQDEGDSVNIIFHFGTETCGDCWCLAHSEMFVVDKEEEEEKEDEEVSSKPPLFPPLADGLDWLVGFAQGNGKCTMQTIPRLLPSRIIQKESNSFSQCVCCRHAVGSLSSCFPASSFTAAARISVAVPSFTSA